MKRTRSAKNTIDSAGIKCNLYQDWSMGLTYRVVQRFESKQVHFSQFSQLISQSVKTVSQSAKVFPRQIYFNLVLDITYRSKNVQCLGSRASWIKISVNPDYFWSSLESDKMHRKFFCQIIRWSPVNSNVSIRRSVRWCHLLVQIISEIQ